MKKLLSVLLVLAMIFSTAAFALPVQMDTAATTAELTSASQTALPEAQTAAEEDYGTLIYNITFDGTETVLDGTRRPVSGYGYVNTEVAGFADATLKSSFTDNEIKDGAAYVGASASYPRIVIYANGSFPEGKYRVSVDFTNNCTDGKRDITFALDNSWLGGMDAAAGATITYTNELTFINNELTLLSNKQKVSTTKFGQLDLYTSIGEKGKSSFVYDNIKIYYTPVKTVSFNCTDVTSQTASAVKVFAGETFTMASAPVLDNVTGFEFKGWSLTEGGSVITDTTLTVTENMTLYAVWEEADVSLVYGEPVINVTFDNPTEALEPDVAKNITTYGTMTSIEGFPSVDKTTLKASFKTAEIKDGAAYVGASNGWPRFTVQFPTSLPKGKYYTSVDFTNTNSDTRETAFARSNDYIYHIMVEPGKTVTFGVEFTYDGSDIIIHTANDRKVTLGDFKDLGFYTGIGDPTTVNNPSTYIYDNIKLYYIPMYDVTFDCTSNTAQTLEGVTVNGGTKLDLSQYNLDNTDTMLFAGWQDKDGNKLSGKVAITSDTTFTAVWVAKEHAEYGTLVYSLDFDDDMALDQPVASYGVVNTPEGFPAAATTKLVSGFTSTEIKDGAVYAKNEVETVAGKRYYPGLGIQASSKYPDGRYYITYDVVSNKTATGAWTQASARLRGSGDVGLDSMDLEPDVQKSFGCYVTVLDGKVYFHAWNKDYVSDYKSVTEFDVMMIIGETASFVVDNIKLYYKAPVTVTFKDSTGNAATVPEAVKMIKGDTLDLSEITCTTENSTLSFEGWSYTAGGELIDGNPVIDESKTLYAVWSDKIKPASYNENSIRVNDPMGIRFKSSVKNEIKADSKTTEYGYIVTTRARLNGKADDYLTFEQNDVFYLTGVNYGYDEKLEANVDRVFGTDDKNTYFTAIVYGISPSKKNYEEVIVVRPYVKYDGQTVYGDPMARSVVDVAKALRDGGYNGLDQNSKKFVTDILEICGENV